MKREEKIGKSVRLEVGTKKDQLLLCTNFNATNMSFLKHIQQQNNFFFLITMTDKEPTGIIISNFQFFQVVGMKI